MQRQGPHRFRLMQLREILTILALFVTIIIAMPTQYAHADSNDAAIVIDANTGKVLYGDHPDAPRYPASLTKMMTLYMLFEALDDGRVTLKTRIPVSKNAAAEPPTKLGIPAGGSVSVQTAIYALITRSANDISTALGEYLGGSEANFAKMMTNKARSLGMTRTTYRNAHGLPNTAQKTTARDQARLGIALRQHFPQYYKYFGTRNFKYGKSNIGNHNKLLGHVKGVDGIKTGYTNASGFNLATSAVSGNRSIVAIVMGGATSASRNKWATRLVTKYLPKASNKRRAKFVIARAASSPVSTPIASLVFPKKAPIPYHRPIATSGIALAYAENDNARGITDAISPQAQLIANVPVPSTRKPDNDNNTLSVEDILHASASSRKQPEPLVQLSEKSPDSTTKASSIQQQRGWVVQVGTAATPDGAKALLNRTQNKADGALDSTEPFALAYNSGGEQIYRARFGGFADQKEAVKACRVLKNNGVGCWASLQ